MSYINDHALAAALYEYRRCSQEQAEGIVEEYLRQAGFRWENGPESMTTASGWKAPSLHRLVGPWQEIPVRDD